MPFTTAQELYTAVMRDHVGPHLRARGFTGPAGKHRRRLPNGWHLIDFQKSYHSRSDEVIATVNIVAVTDEAWAERMAWYAASMPNLTVPDAPRYAFVHGERMGILRTGIDEWYTLRPAEDADDWGARIIADLDEYALPYLERELPSA